MTPPTSRDHEEYIETFKRGFEQWAERSGVALIALGQASVWVPRSDGGRRELQPDASYQIGERRPEEAPDLAVESVSTHDVNWTQYAGSAINEIWRLDVNALKRSVEDPTNVSPTEERPLRAYRWSVTNSTFLEADNRGSTHFPDLDLGMLARSIIAAHRAPIPLVEVRRAVDREIAAARLPTGIDSSDDAPS